MILYSIVNDVDPPSAQDRRVIFGTFFIATVVVSISIFVSGIFYWGYSPKDPKHGHFEKSLLVAHDLVSAVNFFQSEYAIIPDVGSRVTTESPEGIKLLKILIGREEKSDTAQNPRGIKFFDVMEGKKNRNGLIYSTDGTSIEGLYDPWGNPYTIFLNPEGKKDLHFTIGSKTFDLPGRSSAVLSPGKDKMIGTADDVRTW